ncbi:hypothetical protein Tco_0809376 [Tanacetum coccineum]
MYNGGGDVIRCSAEESRWYRYTLDVQRRSIVLHEMFNGGVEMVSGDAIVIHKMFNAGVEMVSLYMRCSTGKSRYSDIDI